jgi:hypothetical protein
VTPRTSLALAFLPVLIAGPAAGSLYGQSRQDPQAPTVEEEPLKQPPPPLFPKHRRGIYTNSDKVEVIDATPQSPPLDVDDPGVPDKGAFEINVLTAADFSPTGHHVDVLRVDANYGIVIKGFGHELPTQVKAEVPVAAQSETGEAYTTGLGPSVFGLKFNFYNDENRGLRMSLYPQIAVAGAESVEKGLADERQSVILAFLLSHESKYVTWVGNATIHQPLHTPERSTAGEIGLGAGRVLVRKLAFMGEVHAESAFDFKTDQQLSVNLGLIYGVRNIVWYARLGRDLISDTEHHTTASFGIKLLVG